MLNDRDPNQENPKSEEQEPESEYHFSDEDVSYELEEDENATQQPAAAPSASFKDKFLSRLSTSKRMLITLGVFLVLIFVVYKMVSPTATQPPTTDITPATVATAPTPTSPNVPAYPAVAQNVAPSVPPPVPIAQGQPSVAQAQPQPQQPMATAPATIPVAPPTTQVTAPPAMQPQQMQPPAVPVATVPPPQMQIPPQQPVATMPSVIPVQTQVAPIATQPPTEMVTAPPMGLSPEAERLIASLQAEYTQRLTDFTNQNKNMNDEIQLLNSRVASLEAELNQLTQQLTEKVRQAPPPPKPEVTPAARVPAAESSPRVSYSVQAIIPGRAWLRADNGETVTVTEGDTVRDLGRITRIDPYDGVVEVNTGTKVVSISYGTGT